MQKSNISLDYSYPGHPAKKWPCPSCKKKRFVRYINLATNDLYPEQYGRCDRQDNCGYFMHPKEGAEFNKDDYGAKQQEEDYHRAAPLELDFKTIDRALMVTTMQRDFTNNNLFIWFADKFGYDIASDLFWQFYAGTGKDGSTIFWQVDDHLNPRTANKVQYVGFNRDKANLPYRLYKKEDGYESCLFGLHQLHGITSKLDYRIGIVESEKTAMLCEAFMPYMPFAGVEIKMIWLASCGCDGLTSPKVKPLRGWKVILISDFSWLSRAKWGLVPMRKKEFNDPDFINPTTLNRGRVSIRMDSAGEIDNSFESAIDRIEEASADSCQGFDYMPDLNDGSDIADILKEWDWETPGFEYEQYYNEDVLTFKKPNFGMYKLSKPTQQVQEFNIEAARQKFLSKGNVKDLINRFSCAIEQINHDK